MRRGALIGLAMLAQAYPASAHAFLERTSPPVGSEVAASPPELSITFTEGVESLFSPIEVIGPNGGAIYGQAAYCTRQQPALMRGTYTVNWNGSIRVSTITA